MQSLDETPRWPLPALSRADATLAIQILETPDAKARGRRFPIGEKLSFGRGDGAADTMVLNDPALSRLHASIEKTPARYQIVDCKSSNGTFVNGVAIDQRSRLNTGDLIRAGETLALFAAFPPPSDEANHSRLLGDSAAVRQVRTALRILSKTGLSVLLTGEPGSGKEMAARFLHEDSGRKGEFVRAECKALLATKDFTPFEQRAKGGTLFLDEITELSASMQAYLLRVVDLPGSNLHIVAGTRGNLAAKVQAHEVRSDLYQRLHSMTVEIPPLRERPEDILFLFKHFFAQASKAAMPALATEVSEKLVLHPWPGNLSELEALATAVALLKQLPARLELAEFKKLSLAQGKDAARFTPTKEALRRLLEVQNGNVAAVAEILSRDRKQVYRWLKAFDLDPSKFRSDAT